MMSRVFSLSLRRVQKTGVSGLVTVNKQHATKLSRKLSSSVTKAVDRKAISSVEQLFRTLPPSMYSDPSIYQMERENIFGNNWIYAGQLDRLRHLGDYLSITLAGYPILIYRSPLTKELVGFHNVCSHRGGPIVPINTTNHGTALYGNQSLLKCQYHAWLYDPRDGALKATPLFGYQFKPEEKKCMSLKRIQLEVFAEQFVFVRLNDIPGQTSINTILADLKSDMLTFPLHEYEYLESQIHPVNCNWKTYVDNYQEGYHLHFIHPELDQAVQYKKYTVMNKKDYYSIHYAPSRHSDGPQDKFLWLYLYPNLALNLYEKGYNVEHILPVGPDRTLICYDFFVRSSSNIAEMDKRIAEAKDSIRRTLAITNEDKMICEQTQINLNSGIYKPGFLSPTMENGVLLFQNRVRNDLKLAPEQFE